jgi:hypothetical protein
MNFGAARRITGRTQPDRKESQMSNEPKVEVRAEQPYVAIPIKVTLREWGMANALVGEVIMAGPARARFVRRALLPVLGDRRYGRKIRYRGGVCPSRAPFPETDA